MSLVTTRLHDVTTTVANAFQYAPFGPRTNLTFGNTLADARSYDSRYRLGAWTLGNLLSYTHSYNRDSNLVARMDLKASSNNRTFGYDEIHRLTNAAGPWGAGTYCSGATYEYDQNGNRKCKGETSATTGYTYTTGTNRLAAATGAEHATYGYDANGNTVDDGPFRYAYNDAGRLATVNEGAVATYTYDGENRRVIKTTPTATTYYFYDPSGRLIQEFDPASNAGEDYLSLHAAPIARMHWSWTVQPPIEDDSADPGENTNDVGDGDGGELDSLIKIIKAETLFYYHTDHLGTPILMTSGSSVPMWRAEHLPFGGLFSNATADIANNLRFPGQYFDAETGLHQNWFRDYSPKTGRYREADPIGKLGGTNLYRYTGANPAAFIDPTGLAFCLYEISVPHLTCVSDDLSQYVTIGRGEVFSGYRECTNDPTCANEEKIGPVPPGNYELLETEKYGGSWFLKQSSWWARLLHKIPLGGDRHLGRGEFFLHIGERSEGCITVNKRSPDAVQRFEQLRNLLHRDATNTIQVVP